MSDTAQDTSSTPDPKEVAEKLTYVAERGQAIVTEFLKRQYEDPNIYQMMDPGIVGKL